MNVAEPTLPRGPGSLVHRNDGDGHWGPSGCLNCGWRGVPTTVGGRILDTCPACENGTEAVLEQLVKEELGRKIGRNDPCYCGSGRKYKKCHGR